MTLHHADHTPLQQIPQLHNTIGICVFTPEPLIGWQTLNVPERLDDSLGAAVSYRGLASPGKRDESSTGPRPQRGRPPGASGAAPLLLTLLLGAATL